MSNMVTPKIDTAIARVRAAVEKGQSDDRANIRSETPMGFARAVFEFNQIRQPFALSA